MVFTSINFLVFLALALVCYYAVPVKVRGYVLLLFSVAFYCIAGLKYVPFIVFAAALSYGTGRYISFRYKVLGDMVKEAQDKQQKDAWTAACKRMCKRAMLIALIILIAVLAYTKFASRLLNLIGEIFSGDFSAWKIIVPLGISYYTFSTIGYVLDIYWKRYDAEKNFLHYLLYVIYFPHILQGPIARYDRLGVQLFKEHRYDGKRMAKGAQLVMWGFFQKLVIADRVGLFVSTVYGSPAEYSGTMLFIATLFYAVQIYADFAGCVNISRGVSSMFGIELEENFNQPYFSQSVAEFWRRWHITLGAWFKDYLCMPVAVSRPVKSLSKKIRQKWGKTAGKNTVTLASLVAVWICTGLWHGTGLSYVLWGCWQGGIIALSTLLEPNYAVWKNKLHIKDKAKLWQLFRILRTFVLTGIIPRIITRATSLSDSMLIFKKIFTSFTPEIFTDGTLFACGLDVPNFIVAMAAIAILFIISLVREHGIDIREKITNLNIVLRWPIYLIIIFVILIFGIYGAGYDASSFAYMQF